MKKTKLLKPMWNLLLLLMAMLVPQGAWAMWQDSAGAKHIVNADDFADFSRFVNQGILTSVTGNFKLDYDITLPSDWVAIGTDNSDKRFAGTFDGQGHTITFSGSSQGLFGCTDGATIKNLKLAGSISSGQDNTGSVVSTARGATKIYNVYSSVGITMTAAKSHIGGIAGQILQADGKTGEIKGCTYSGEMNLVSSTDSNGGIVGYCGLNANIEIENCFFSGSISSTGSNPRIGGILGYADDDGSTQNFKYIRNCFCDGTLSPSTGNYVGIFAGYPRGKVKDVISNNTYVSTASTNMAGNSTHTTAANNGCKKITISITAGSNGTVSQSYVNPSTEQATQLQVVATPNAHYHLNKWSDNGAQTHNVGLTDNVNLSASFAIDQHAITVKTNDSNMGTVCGGGTYNYGSTKTITATPKTHYHFVKWNDGDTNASRTITVTEDKTYTATFAIDQHTITVKTNNSNYGTVSGGGTFDYGSAETITATPRTGYHFVKWSDGNTSASRTITVNGNATYTATFAAHTYGDWITDVAATCTTSGTKHRQCTHTGCDDRIDEGTVIPATGHSFADDDLAQGVCTTCHHGFFRYTSKDNVVVIPNFYPALTDADGNQLTHISNTNVDGKGVIEFNKPLAYIGTSAFSRKTDLTGMTIPYSVTGIGNAAFRLCTGITGDLVIPESVTSIGDNAFDGCGFTGNLVIPESVTSIGNCAFYGCTGFKSVVLKSRPQIGVYVFERVTSNISLILNDNSYIYTDDNFYFPAVQSASYTRALEAGKTVTFILPFDIPVDNINGKVYVLTSFEDETLTFSEPADGIAHANKPYLLTETVEGNLMKAPVSAISVREPQTIKIGKASMVGTYTKQTGLFSTAEESIYGYSGGQFVRQKSKEERATQGATLNPFRALIKVKGEVSQTLKIQFVDKAGNLTASDVVAIRDIILSDSQSEEELNKYDLNNDDEISVIDLTKLVKYLNAEHANLQTVGAATEGLEFE